MKLKAALTFVAVMLLGVSAWSQDAPKASILLDYSYSHYGAVDYASPNYNFGQWFSLNGGGGSFVYNLRPYLGFRADLQGYESDTKLVRLPPGNPYLPAGGSVNLSGNLFTYLFGLEVGGHKGKLHPFADGMVGGAHSNLYGSLNLPALNLTGVTANNSNDAFAATAGVGFDVAMSHKISIRVGEFDYLYTDFSSKINLGANQNSWRYLAGVELNFGGKPPIPPAASVTVSPTEILAGDPVTATMTTQNFNPKHTIAYKWASSGGSVSGTGETGNVTTTGLAPGNYTVTGTATDEKEKKNNVATASASFTVKVPQPPVVSCTANPTSITPGLTANITMTASSPDNRPLRYTWTSDGGQVSGSGTSATLTASQADAGHSITVTGTASDDRNLQTTCTAAIEVPAPPPPPAPACVSIEDWGQCTFEKDPRRPWRVDNDCKDTLDKLALRLQQAPTGTLDIAGSTSEAEAAKSPTLGAQRAVNTKYYLTTDGPTKSDASRIHPRQGGTEGQIVDFRFVPEGNLCSGQTEPGSAVDETTIQPQTRTGRKVKPAAPPAP